MSDTPAAVMDRFIAAFEAGDLAGACAVLHPEAVVHEAAGLPYTGEHKGPDGFAAPMLEIYTVRDGTIRDVDVYYEDPAAVASLHGTG